ncbi:hypothetical protein [Mycobacterium asiaticum]|uniref:hypothetical protein n=1 Tax=Mycobacterium asiaticum TaxID=1790 RepID=UPI00114E688E|nr:hypothetical protein [Mycobacterium asiaticum]
MKKTAIAAAVLVATALATAGPAQADPRSEVQELQQQTSELHASWDSLTPAQRQERLAQLNRQTSIVQNETQHLPPEQQPEIELRLGQVALELADLLRKVWPAP